MSSFDSEEDIMIVLACRELKNSLRFWIHHIKYLSYCRKYRRLMLGRIGLSEIFAILSKTDGADPIRTSARPR